MFHLFASSLVFLALSTAHAAPASYFAGYLDPLHAVDYVNVTCASAATGKPFATIQLQGKQSQVTFAGGYKTALQVTKKVENKSGGGCMKFVDVTQTLFHPYYDIVLKHSFQYGEVLTRCAGMFQSSVKGVYSAEMQQPMLLNCKLMNP